MISFIDLQAQYSRIQDEVEQSVLRIMRSGTFILGPEVAKLEERLASYVGVKHCVSCASGTDALVMALMAKGVGPGDAVFTVPFTFMASAEAIATVGATPVFVDIEADTFNIDTGALDRAVKALAAGDRSIHPLPRLSDEQIASLKPRGIIAVDLFGLPADYSAINAIADANDLFVIEDAAQSFGASANNSRAGGLAEIGCTSFFPAKPLGCYGDGGAIFTNDPAFADLLKSIRVHGQGSDKYDNVRLGITGRLDAIQAGVLQVKLDIFDDEMEQRQRVAASYRRAIAASGLDLVAPAVPEHLVSAWAQYTVIAADDAARSEFQSRLSAKGIPTAIYYPKALHVQQAFAYLGYAEGDFPVSEMLGNRVFSLPMHPYLPDTQIDEIVEALKG
ncbi:DegT/DnrJ/EryC1/StrS aminotransferase family protein [Sphingomonas sp. LM7]|uniref:DegT/DnrJ/EryC1/StrS family aminotransferase n=1 Tax=Sphingomonas sp. LM7 TaxID=1938607 RepID=UPI000983A058|nr:DegT/DnrJ/EryC1/StrS family aminotransferase [Sphingomonas sp. LM7]AQR75534.1 aminotransferase DegT [Sphingomonas sp. LM7]